MLADQQRVAAYKRSIHQTIKPGDIVADIGTGTGILAFLALAAGARKVYAFESGDIVETARQMAADNGMRDKIDFINTDSRDATLSEKVDVIITETFGGMGIDEGAIDILADARERFLKPGGRILPEYLRLFAVPVQFSAGHPFRSVNKALDGLDTTSLVGLAVNTVYGLRESELSGCQALAAPGQLYAADLSNCRPLAFPVELTSADMRLSSGRYDGIVVYPEFAFPGEETLSLFDGRHFSPCHWELAFFPGPDALSVDDGDELKFHLSITHTKGLIWKHVVAHGGDQATYAHLTAFGLPSLKRIVRG
jgi:protein arginine N-methyltransferase 1